MRSKEIIVEDGIQFISPKAYTAFHKCIKDVYGKANHCANPKCSKVNTRYQWCLKVGRHYSSNVDDYIQMCATCHTRYDKRQANQRKHKVTEHPTYAVKFYLSQKRRAKQAPISNSNIIIY